MSRRRIAAVLALVAAVAAMPEGATAQVWKSQSTSTTSDGATGSPPERIDLTLPPPLRSTEAECRARNEGAEISGEIVVCATIPRESQRLYDREDAQRRHAERTAFTKNPATPDVAGPGIFRGPATFSNICLKGIFNCPKPPAVFVDVAALPKAPPGSDADRIARGLEPLGTDGPRASRPLTEQERAELGLPEPAPAVTRAGSAGPGAPR